MNNDPETALRRLWDAMGIPQDKQDAIVADIRKAAEPGARVGPFRVIEGGRHD
jgi:hypothetical protein